MYKTLTFLLLSAIADVEFIGTADSDLFSCYYGEGEDPVLSSVQECHPETNRWCLKIISEDPSLQLRQCDTGDICPEFGNRCAKADFNLSSIKMSFDAYTVCCCDSLKCNMTNPNVSKPSIIAFLLIMIVLICCIL